MFKCVYYGAILLVFLVNKSPTMLKLRSKITRTLVSMLVRFFLRRPGRPSSPNMGEEREDGLGSMLSTAMVSVRETDIIQKRDREMKTCRPTDRKAVKTRMVCSILSKHFNSFNRHSESEQCFHQHFFFVQRVISQTLKPCNLNDCS